MATVFELPGRCVERDPEPNVFRVVHPLDDEPEAKFDPDALGPMHMSASVKLSLFLLRVYLFAMIALVAYRVLELATGLGHI